MSYLGQAKWIPGQVSFSTLPPGQTSLPSLQPLVEAGLPIAPYIEHGSWVTGEPAIMRYGRDPYRGLGGFAESMAAVRRERDRYDRLKKVGFWFADDDMNRRYPRAESCVSPNWSPHERRAVLAYVRAGKQGECYRGWSSCRICGTNNGSCDLTDGTYVWPEGLGHYIERHGVKPPEHFIRHATRSEIHMGLGQTPTARHMDATYVVLCDNWARFSGISAGHRLRGLRAAILSAKNAARRAPGDTCRIYPPSAGPLFMTERGLIAVRAKRGGDYDVKVIRSPPGLSGAFEDLQQVEKNWGRNMLARLGKATFQLSNSFYVNVAPEAAKGLKPALSRAKAILADNQGDGYVDVAYVTQRGERPLFPSTTIVVRIDRQGGTLRLTWMPQIAPQAPVGLAGPLTEFVCSDTQAGQMLSSAVNEAIDQGAMAAAIGAVVAGAIGGMLEKPGIGALVGAAVGYVAHYAWTAPYRR